MPEAHYERLWLALLSGRAIRAEHINRTKGGSLVTVEASASPILSESGDLQGFVAIQRDLTAQKTAEAVLRESEARLAEVSEMNRAIFEASPVGIGLYDVESGQCVTANDAFARVIGRPLPSVLQQNFRRIKSWPESGLSELAELALTQGASGPVDVHIHTTAGREAWLNSRFLTLSVNGRTHLLLIVNDVTDRRRVEDQLRHAQKMEAVGHLAAGVAHDFNNVLTAILGYADLIADAPETTALQRRDLAEVTGAAERAVGLTRQLLMFSRRQATQRTVVSINDVIEGLERLLQRTMGDQVAIALRLDPAAGLMTADKIELEQVLLNLAVNARDAMPSGGTLTIASEGVTLAEEPARAKCLADAGAYVKVAVSDTGVGIAPDVRARLFEPFFTTKGVGRGTGLGLSIVHSIVTENGGAIDVDSTVGQGTTFAIYLPRLEGARLPAAAAAHGPSGRGGHETVLVADDDAVLQVLVARILRQAGYTVLMAGTVSAALHMAAGYGDPIHLLVTDVVMPGGGGIELADRLTRQRPDMRVLFVSGYADKSEPRWHMAEAMRTNFLPKPFVAEQLLEKVREILDREPVGV